MAAETETESESALTSAPSVPAPGPPLLGRPRAGARAGGGASRGAVGPRAPGLPLENACLEFCS